LCHHFLVANIYSPSFLLVNCHRWHHVLRSSRKTTSKERLRVWGREDLRSSEHWVRLPEKSTALICGLHRDIISTNTS
jgi:hypothetical protein